MTQREIILDHAMNMFVKQGVKAVRMDDIARELSVSKRTLYELFDDKEELLYQSILRFTKLGAERRMEHIQSIDNRLEAMIFALRDMMSHAPTASRLRRNMQRFYPSVFNRLEHEFIVQQNQTISQWIKDCIADGYFTTTADSDFVVRILVESTQGIIHSDTFDAYDTIDMVSYVSYSVIIFIRGLCTAKGMEIIDRTFSKYFGNMVG
jgi:AcrR family transcriptional regulator